MELPYKTTEHLPTTTYSPTQRCICGPLDLGSQQRNQPNPFRKLHAWAKKLIKPSLFVTNVSTEMSMQQPSQQSGKREERVTFGSQTLRSMTIIRKKKESVILVGRYLQALRSATTSQHHLVRSRCFWSPWLKMLIFESVIPQWQQ